MATADTNVIDNDDTDHDIPSLRNAAKAGREAVAEAARLRKENLFLKAGIDTERGVGKLLFLTYDGDNVEDLKIQAREVGLDVDRTNAVSIANEVDTQQQTFREQLSGGTPSGNTPVDTPHPLDAALNGYQEDRRRGTTDESARLAAVDRIIVAASKGDKRVIFDQGAWAQEQLRAGHGQ